MAEESNKEMMAAPETAGGRCGRKKKAAENEARKKKPPQRGMGVEMLERLRLQGERLKMMKSLTAAAGVNGTVPPPPPPPFLQHDHPSSVVFAHGGGTMSGPVVFPAVMSSNGGGFVHAATPAPPVHHQHHMTTPFHPKIASFGYGQLISPPNYSSASHIDLYGFGGSNLSAVNPSSLSDHHSCCIHCHKKKRLNDGELGNNQRVNIIGENQAADHFTGFSTSPFSRVGNTDKSLKIGSSSRGSSGVMTGHEFFPAERNNNNNNNNNNVVSHNYINDEMMMMMMMMTPSESSSPVITDAAMATTSSGEASFDAGSNTIDLSLRLSLTS